MATVKKKALVIKTISFTVTLLSLERKKHFLIQIYYRLKIAKKGADLY